jgi:hypothetical protein
MDDDDDKKLAAKEDPKTSPKSISVDADFVDLTEDAAAAGSAHAEADNDDLLDSEDVDSLSDASDHAWDSDTLAAVARTTHHQMIKRQPILIGCNRDGSINVQLPNGNIIVAERSAFPKFDKTGPMEKRRQAQRIKKDQFAYLARKDKVYTDTIPRTWEIEHFLHLNASSVFHVFDRRVNVRSISCIYKYAATNFSNNSSNSSSINVLTIIAYFLTLYKAGPIFSVLLQLRVAAGLGARRSLPLHTAVGRSTH